MAKVVSVGGEGEMDMTELAFHHMSRAEIGLQIANHGVAAETTVEPANVRADQGHEDLNPGEVFTIRGAPTTIVKGSGALS